MDWLAASRAALGVQEIYITLTLFSSAVATCILNNIASIPNIKSNSLIFIVPSLYKKWNKLLSFAYWSSPHPHFLIKHIRPVLTSSGNKEKATLKNLNKNF